MTPREQILSLGWNLSEETNCWEEGGFLFFTVMPEDITGYTVQINPETGKSRHCGNGAGCFWTEWE